jgi:hypothetical protein
MFSLLGDGGLASPVGGSGAKKGDDAIDIELNVGESSGGLVTGSGSVSE